MINRKGCIDNPNANANIHPDRDFQWLLWCTKPGTFGGSCTAYNKRQSMTEISSADIMSIALNLLN